MESRRSITRIATVEPGWIKEIQSLADFSSIVLPEQLYATPTSPERRLALSVLKFAIRDLLNTNENYSRNGSTLARKDNFETAWNWAFRSDEAEWIYPFDSVCGLLGIDPSWFRTKLKMVMANAKRPRISFRTQARGSRHTVRDFTEA